MIDFGGMELPWWLLVLSLVAIVAVFFALFGKGGRNDKPGKQ